jgi:diguanylate cyclase (GGDEF)-like protein
LDENFAVGVLSPLLAGTYYGGILKGVARAVAKAGGRVVGLQTFDTGRDEAVYLRPSTFRYPIGWGSLSGFVVILNAADHQYLKALRATGMPITMISETFPGLDLPVVAPDNRAGVRESVIHLLEHGHRRIAFAGHVAQDDIRARYEAYRETLIEHDIEPDPRLLFDGTDAVESGGEHAARRMLEAGLPSTAVLCGTDFNAIGLMRTLSAAGYRIPADQAVVGFDGVKAGKYVTPSLSTAEARFDEVGETAGDVLMRHLAGEPMTADHYSVPTSFLVRESCGCPPGENADADARTKVEELFQEETDLERTLTTQYQISMDLLRSHDEDPRALEWLRRSRATRGCLGLWEGDRLGEPDPTLEIVGTFERAPDGPAVSVSRCTATAFPPAELIQAVKRPADEIVYVVPVKMRSNDWGMLSFVGPIDTQRSVSLETMNQWAAVLSVALDRQAVLESLRAQDERLRRAALYDSLTGLPNRALFLERIRDALHRAKWIPGYQFAVLFLDLDGFKVVNDSLGHLAGDRLLSEIADRISADLRAGDTAARFGGDEFAILVDGVADSPTLNSIARRLQAVIASPLGSVGQEVAITASIGIAPSTRRYDTAEDLLRDADIAMYWAKTRDKGTHVTFDASMHAEAVARLRTEAQLRRAIEREELELHYQPIVEMATASTIAFEALLRWNHPTRGLLVPAQFLPVAEDAGLMLPIGSWVIDQVCQQLATWRRTGATRENVWVSLNVSNRQFWSGSVNDEITKCLRANNIPPDCLAVEITEGVIMHNVTTARALLEQLHDQGIKLYVDDFGTGYSSLGVVHQLPIDALKIDRSFITTLANDTKTKELVRTIVLMGDNLGIDVIAEGIETEQQCTELRQLGCRYGQGYWFSRPVTGSLELSQPVPDPMVHGGQRTY